MAKEPKYRILVVDDDESLSELIGTFYRTRGYTVEKSVDALGPLSRLRKTQGQPPWDLILTDMKLPGMNGIEFIREVKQLAPLLPVVLMTAHGGMEMAVKAVRDGAYDFVVKPLKFPELTVTLERALSHRKLQEENQTLREVIKESKTPSKVIAKSAAMKFVWDVASRVSNSLATVLIQGESGSGKEVLARSIHEMSNRKSKPFVAINCASIPENLLESELFGFAKGAFTGAIDRKIGLFEEANEGTFFLDEIGDLSAMLQAKLLRVLQEKKIKRIGENEERPIDVRIIAATHRNLAQEVVEQKFREDLYFRLNVIPIHIPPLRDRREDIMPLAEYFLKKFIISNQSPVTGISKQALDELTRMPWRGNVRELENTIERAVVLCEGTEIQVKDLKSFSNLTDLNVPSASKTPTLTEDDSCFIGVSKDTAEDALPSLHDLELKYINWILRKVGGVREKARKILDIDRKTLSKKAHQISGFYSN